MFSSVLQVSYKCIEYQKLINTRFVHLMGFQTRDLRGEQFVPNHWFKLLVVFSLYNLLGARLIARPQRASCKFDRYMIMLIQGSRSWFRYGFGTVSVRRTEELFGRFRSLPVSVLFGFVRQF